MTQSLKVFADSLRLFKPPTVPLRRVTHYQPGDVDVQFTKSHSEFAASRTVLKLHRRCYPEIMIVHEFTMSFVKAC